MACFHPVRAFQGSDDLVRFHESKAFPSIRDLQLPCGHCVGCRLERSRQWAIRCVHESKLYENNSFVTLTYNESCLPVSLNYRDYQLFMKRLRKVFTGVRFFMCGEYGPQTLRPHFHACLFNVGFSDRLFLSTTASGSSLYRSARLEALWPHGFSTVGDVTFESAAYCARYVMDKVVGDLAEAHYGYVDVETGEIRRREPEFCHMSLKPGIGARWFEKYCSDVYPGGMVVVNGVEVRPPKYYDRLYGRIDDDGLADLAMRREQFGHLQCADNTDRRLADREVVTKRRVGFLKRSFAEEL